jgi:hypothetical protein
MLHTVHFVLRSQWPRLLAFALVGACAGAIAGVFELVFEQVTGGHLLSQFGKGPPIAACMIVSFVGFFACDLYVTVQAARRLAIVTR